MARPEDEQTARGDRGAGLLRGANDGAAGRAKARSLRTFLAVWAVVGVALGAVHGATGDSLAAAFLFLAWLALSPLVWFQAIWVALGPLSPTARLASVVAPPLVVLSALLAAPAARWIVWPTAESLSARFRERHETFDRIRALLDAGEDPGSSAELDRLAARIGRGIHPRANGGIEIPVWSVGLVPDGLAYSFVWCEREPGEVVADLPAYEPTRDDFRVYVRLGDGWFLEREEW